MRIALFANPDSGTGGASAVEAELARLGAEVSAHGLDEADSAVAAGVERAVVAGGDGSLACVAVAAGRAGVPMAVVPTGTANDFARELEIPSDLEAACELAVRGTGTRVLDVARMGERPFLNVASLGLSPAAARRASGLKGTLGPVAYFAGALGAGLRAQPVRCTVRCDGRDVFDGRAWQVSVACTGAFGAGSSIDANPHDGRLDVVVIEARSRARLVAHAYGLRRGHVGQQTGAQTDRCSIAELELEAPREMNVDGELVKSASTRFDVLPTGVEVVVG